MFYRNLWLNMLELRNNGMKTVMMINFIEILYSGVSTAMDNNVNVKNRQHNTAFINNDNMNNR